MIEVFNLFNHANYTAYVTQLSATSAATTARTMFATPASNTQDSGHCPMLVTKWQSHASPMYTIQCRRCEAMRTAVSAA